MPTETTIVDRLALDGPLSAPVAVLIGLLVIALLAWALWRERRILGPRYTVLFWCLRTLAIATAFWMLLAPANHRVETSTTKRAVVFAADRTGSMQTIDPPGTSDELRWAVATQAGGAASAVERVDRAVAAIGHAQRQLKLATQAIQQHRPESEVVSAAQSAQRGIENAATYIRELQQSKETQTDVRAAELATTLTTALESTEFQDFQRLTSALEKGRTPSDKGWRESLPDLVFRLATIQRSLHELARHVAALETNRIARAEPERLTAMSGLPRIGRVSGFLGELRETVLDGLQELADVRIDAFDQTLTRITDFTSLAPTRPREDEGVRASGTDLASTLRELQQQERDQPVAAVFLLTDVAHNERSESSPQEMARRFQNTPVYVIPIGNSEHVRDVILRSVSAPAVAMRNDDIVIEATLEAYDCEGEVCHVELLQRGVVIDFRDVAIDSSYASRSVRFEQRVPEVGTEAFQIAVTPLVRELTEENNYGEAEVNVTRGDIQVLLADEMPRWEYRYLTQLFRRDPKVSCDELLFRPRQIATGRREQTKTLPITVDEWDQYDVVILGDLPSEHFSVASQEGMREYLQKRGGTVVLIAGQQAMPQGYIGHPLEEILPVQPLEDDSASANGFAFRVTRAGEEHDALMIAETESATRTAWDFVNRYSPLQDVSKWRRPRPSAETLIAAVPRGSVDAESAMTSSAFLCWQPIGRGRVIYLSGPETYRLRFLRGDSLHYRFWGQMLRWAIASDLTTGSELVRIRTSQSRYETGESVSVTVQLTNKDGEPRVANGIELQLSSGTENRTVPLFPSDNVPGEYRAEIQSLSPGVYRLEPMGDVITELRQDSLEEPVVSITVQAKIPPEMIDTRSDRWLAQQIAAVTGGQVLPPTAVAEILSLTNLEPIVTETVIRKPLWLQWRYLWMIFGCLQIEWIIRKWKGLS